MVRNTELSDLTQYPNEYFYNSNKETLAIDDSGNDVMFFVKCKIKNISETHKVTSDMDLRTFMVYQDGRADFEEGSCYFDKPQHTEGEDRIHQFFWYTFEAGEELDCTIGFIVNDYVDDGTIKYYVGRYPSIWNEKKHWEEGDIVDCAIPFSEIKEGND